MKAASVCWADPADAGRLGVRGPSSVHGWSAGYLYAFSAVSPHDGVIDSLVLPWVNAHTMSLFLAEVAQRHAQEFVLVVMDRAGWHLATKLSVPANVRLIFLPPYSPELNPAEHLWKSLRQDCFANRTLSSLDAVERTLVKGLLDLERDADRTQSMTGFNWITSISLKAN